MQGLLQQHQTSFDTSKLLHACLKTQLMQLSKTRLPHLAIGALSPAAEV